MFRLLFCYFILTTRSFALINVSNPNYIEPISFDINFNLSHQNTVTISKDAPVEWIRLSNSLPVPRQKITIFSNKEYTYRYQDNIFYSQIKNLKTFSSFYVSPFIDNFIHVYEEDKLVETILVTTNSKKISSTFDKSCAKVKFTFHSPIINNFIFSCVFDYKKEGLKNLIILIASDQVQKNKKVMRIHAQNNARVNIKKAKLSFSGQYDQFDKKLSLSIGLGPYAFNTSIETKNKKATSAAIMLYSNYKLNQENSIRAFSASIFQTSSFHNIGLYLANDFFKTSDNDFILSSLLGIQYLDFKFNSNTQKFGEPLYPQGLEFTYKNLFSNSNYIISGGVFINPSESSEYHNSWIRWGDRYFYEINYINWSSENFKATMWGISMIFPIGKFF